MRFWREKGLLPINGEDMLDFGCGKDSTADNRFDPFHAPNYELLLRRWSVVTCNYVLNVQPVEHLMLQIALLVRGLLHQTDLDGGPGVALFAVWNAPHQGLLRSGKGWQNAKSCDQWEALLKTAFDVEVMQDNGTFFAFYCTAKESA